LKLAIRKIFANIALDMKPEITLKSALFEAEKLDQYALYLSFEAAGLHYAVVRVQDRRLLYLQDYQFPTASNAAELFSWLQEVFNQDWYLKANFWQSINILCHTEAFTLLPISLYQSNRNADYLQWISSSEHATTNSNLAMAPIKGQLLSSIRTDYIQWFKDMYPQGKVAFYPQIYAFLKHVIAHSEKLKKAYVYAELIDNKLFVGVWRNLKLELCNEYHCPTAQDVSYFILLVMDELRLDREECEVKLLGKISPVSEVVRLLRTYIRHVTIGHGKPAWLEMGAEFDNLPYHYYADLFAMAL
jgi:hypothetical protein